MMSKNISFDYSNASDFLGQNEVSEMKFTAVNASEKLKSGKGEGNDFQGWINLPVNYDKDELKYEIADVMNYCILLCHEYLILLYSVYLVLNDKPKIHHQHLLLA